MSVTRERIQGETAAAAMCITRDEISYPANLREIPLPPERLWVRGRLEADDTLAIAIVGARGLGAGDQAISAKRGGHSGARISRGPDERGLARPLRAVWRGFEGRLLYWSALCREHGH